MKILTVVLNLKKGGTQRAAQNFCEAYAILGHDSKLVSVNEGGLRQEELLKQNIKVWIGTSSQVLEEIKNWQPDVVHVHSLGIEAKVIFTLRNICPDATFVETNVFSEPTAYSNILDFSYQLSDWCKYLYLSRGGNKEKCINIPNPVKVDSFFKSDLQETIAFKKQYNIPENAFLFGRIGQRYYGKWSYYLIDLFEKFRKEVNDHAYLIVVNPPKEIIEYIQEKSLSQKVIIIERLEKDEDLRRCYSSMDIFLHIANQGESFGLVLAEALLCETPVITLNTPWGDNSQCEVVGHQVGGYCANTLKEFYTYMKKMYMDAGLRKKLGHHGRQRIIENYDYLTVAQNSLKHIQSKKNNASPNSFHIKSLPQGYIKLSLPLLWFKLHYFKQHKIINYLLKRIANFDLRNP
jgi:glycosyltransferase involved in cell wall biosynthesis